MFLGVGVAAHGRPGAGCSPTPSPLQVPHFMFVPGLAIFITVLAFNLFGDGLRDALDPRAVTRRRYRRVRSAGPSTKGGTSDDRNAQDEQLVAAAAVARAGARPPAAAAAAPTRASGEAAPARAGSTRRPTEVVNPSDKKGGTLKLGHAGRRDSFDPGDTYYGYSGTSPRYYARTLVTFKPAPGKDGLELVPDLADGPAASPATAARPGPTSSSTGLKFEDGTPITSKDIKYGVERVLRPDVCQRPDLPRRPARPAGRTTRARTRTPTPTSWL